MALTDRLVQINKLKLGLDELQPMSLENEKKLWNKIRLDWNFNSNHIEGNTLTYGETQLLLMFDKTTGDHELREYDEMKAHDVAIHMVKEWAKDKARDLSENDIRELNKIILVQAYWKDAITPDGQSTRRQIKVGEYKEYPNSVRQKNGEIFEYASPFETPHKMADLMQWYRNNEIQHPLIFASQFHYDFIRIHPFDDGNGRIARLLVNYVLMKFDYPPIVIKSSEKEKYLTALNKADVGDLNAFHEYMADQLISSLEMATKVGLGENIDEEGDLDKKISMLKMEIAEIDKDNEVQLRFDKNVFEGIYDSWLTLLMTKAIVQIKKFDDLFADPSHHIIIRTGEHHGHGGQIVSVNFAGKNEAEIISELKNTLFQKTAFISADTTVSIHATYGTFKKGALKMPFGCNYHIEVLFDYLKYEIYAPHFYAENGFVITDQVRENISSNENYKHVYIDEEGNIYPGGKAGDQIKDLHGKKIIADFSREDILDGKVKDRAMFRFVEPRLLHKPFSSSEIDTLSKEFGEVIFNHIDYRTKKAGLR
jgi:Fic family protein